MCFFTPLSGYDIETVFIPYRTPCGIPCNILFSRDPTSHVTTGTSFMACDTRYVYHTQEDLTPHAPSFLTACRTVYHTAYAYYLRWRVDGSAVLSQTYGVYRIRMACGTRYTIQCVCDSTYNHQYCADVGVKSGVG